MKKIETTIVTSQLFSFQEIINNIHVSNYTVIPIEKLNNEMNEETKLVSIICKDSLEKIIVDLIIQELKKSPDPINSIVVSNIETFQLI